jgi:hypothetical protein
MEMFLYSLKFPCVNFPLLFFPPFNLVVYTTKKQSKHPSEESASVYF